MKEQDNFDAVRKWCNNCPCDSGLMELDVSGLWVLEHAEELRKKATSDSWPAGALKELEELIQEGEIQKSYEELGTKHGKDVSAFFKQIMALMANWANFELFRKSTAFARQFGNSHFLIVQSMLECVILQLTRLLTDKKGVRGHKVLTIERLADAILDGNVKKESFMARIKEVQELPVVKKLEVEWRHNRLAHNNYDAALGVSRLSPVKTEDVDKAIETFVAVFRDLGRELGN